MDVIGRACSMYRGEETRRQVSFGQPEGKRPFERYKRRWKDNIKKDSKEIEWNSRDQIGKAEVRKIGRIFKNLGFHKRRRMPWMADGVLVPQLIFFIELIWLLSQFKSPANLTL